MKRILAVLVVAGLVLGVAGPVRAGADTDSYRISVHGVEAWITDLAEDSPPGRYYEAYVQAFVAQDTRDGKSMDWIYIAYGVATKHRNGDVEWGGGAAGYAPNGAAGLDMTIGDLGEATVRASIPVGYCAAWASEDDGGDCTRYVNVGTVDLDLAWTASSELRTWNSTDHQVSPASWLEVGGGIHHYREAVVGGQLSIPKLGTRGIVTSTDGWDGYLTRWRGHELNLTVIPGPPS